MMSRAGLNRFTPRAGLLLMLAANAPDIDVVTWFGGSLTYLKYHRWYTHSLIMMPAVALLPVLIAGAFSRRNFRWLPAYGLSILAVASHLLLDWTNVYGIQLLLPFSDRWLRLDTTSVVDPWIWAALFLGTAAPFLSRLVSSEIGARTSPGRGAAIFALCALTFYDFSRYLTHNRALSILDARLYEGAPAARVAAFPRLTNPFQWTGFVEGQGFVTLYRLDVLGDFDPGSGRLFYKPEANPAIDAARRDPTMQTFLQFAQYPLWRVTPLADPENARLVECLNLRFGTPARPGFAASAIVDPSGHVSNARFGFGGIRSTSGPGANSTH